MESFKDWEQKFVKENKVYLLKIARKIEQMKKKDPEKYKEIMEVVKQQIG